MCVIYMHVNQEARLRPSATPSFRRKLCVCVCIFRCIYHLYLFSAFISLIEPIFLDHVIGVTADLL